MTDAIVELSKSSVAKKIDNSTVILRKNVKVGCRTTKVSRSCVKEIAKRGRAYSRPTMTLGSKSKDLTTPQIQLIDR